MIIKHVPSKNTVAFDSLDTGDLFSIPASENGYFDESDGNIYMKTMRSRVGEIMITEIGAVNLLTGKYDINFTGRQVIKKNGILEVE